MVVVVLVTGGAPVAEVEVAEVTSMAEVEELAPVAHWHASESRYIFFFLERVFSYPCTSLRYTAFLIRTRRTI